METRNEPSLSLNSSSLRHEISFDTLRNQSDFHGMAISAWPQPLPWGV